MSICLVHTPVPELLDDRLDPPMGLLYLATVLRNADIGVEILDLSGIPEEEWEFPEADWYGFSTYTASYNRTVKIKDIVKQLYPSAKTIAGGPHASALPEEVAKEFDHVFVGEAEASLLWFMQMQSLASVTPGFAHLRDERIIRGQPMSIHKIPMPDYSLVELDGYTRRFAGKQSFQILTGRGCPYDCGFCSKLPDGRKLRKRNVDSVLHEIQYILAEYGDVSFRFKDDLFTVGPTWLREFANRYPGVEYSCNVRADYHPDVPGLLRDSGCQIACMGIESGSDLVLKRMGKGITRQQNIDGIKGLKEKGIQVLAWILIGYPGETWQTFYETVSLLDETRPDVITAYPLIPYPGTKIHSEVDILDHNYDNYFYIHGNREAGFVYQTPQLPRAEIQSMFARMKMHIGTGRQREYASVQEAVV